MPWEVFCRGDHAAVLQPAHVRDGLARHVLPVLAEAAFVDHRVRRVVVHIGHRAEAHMHAEAFHLAGDLEAHAFDEGIVAQCPERHLLRETHAAVEAHAQTPFQVHADEQRCFRDRLIVVGEGCLTGRTTLEEDEAADVALLDQRIDLLLVLRALVAPGSNHHQLRDLLVEAQRGIDAVGPRRSFHQERRWKSMRTGCRLAGTEEEESRCGEGDECVCAHAYRADRRRSPAKLPGC